MMKLRIAILLVLLFCGIRVQCMEQQLEGYYNTKIKKVGQGTCSDRYPVDCSDIYDHISQCSGVYTVYVGLYRKPVQVFCDMDTEPGKAWTVIQRRMDGLENFNRNWAGYQNGFGDRHGEFWAGNEALHWLTNQASYGARVDLKRFNGQTGNVTYTTFRVGPLSDRYRLEVNGFSSSDATTWGDSMAFHNGLQFSTYDEGVDSNAFECAKYYKGGWWYKFCARYLPTGIYKNSAPITNGQGVLWYNNVGGQESLPFAEMKVMRL